MRSAFPAGVLLVALVLPFAGCAERPELAAHEAQRCGGTAAMAAGKEKRTADAKALPAAKNLKLLVPKCPTAAQRWVPGAH